MLVRTFVARGFRLWLLTRLLIIAVFFFTGGLGGGAENPFKLASIAVASVIAMSVVVGLVETVRRRELALLGNLGVSRGYLVAFYGIPALFGEIVLRLVTAPFQ
jgi:hypothetical protein